MKKFLRLSDNQWPFTEADLDPLMKFPNRNFKPNEVEYVEPVPLAKPSINEMTQEVVEAHPVELDGVWTQQWDVVDKFSTYTDEDGVVHTKEEQETAAQDILDRATAGTVRVTRDALLQETDFHALSDTDMSEAMTTYRQALRDVPEQDGFPHEVTWPDSP
jgi:hypothetical protein